VFAVPRSRHVRMATLALFLAQSACTTTVHAPLTTNVNQDKITGVTLKSGRNIAFNPPGASLQGDKLYANGPTGQIIVPTDSIAEVWTKETSTAKTIGVVVAVVAVLGLFIVVADKTAGSSSSSY